MISEKPRGDGEKKQKETETRFHENICYYIGSLLLQGSLLSK